MLGPMLILLLACAHQEPSLRKSRPEPRAFYAMSIADAAVAEPGEVSTLVSITHEDPKVQWVGESGRLRLVTWTDWDGYDSKVGAEMTLSREVWVTVSPELQSRCKNWKKTGDELSIRLGELLGLPPEAKKDRFVVVNAAPEDLFRPCPDPEITDNSCALRFPDGVSDAHRAWFTELQGKSYGINGYPWTRLGYTYDWASRKESRKQTEVGLSELVIRSGATIHIEAVQKTADYCADL